jgi:hypothetical protein
LQPLHDLDMAKRRIEIDLPKGVERKFVKGRAYLYFTPNRGTPNEGERIRLPAFESPAFWLELDRLTKTHTVFPTNSIGGLVKRYKDSSDFQKLSPSTKTSYNIALRQFSENWGNFDVNELTPYAVLTARDAMKATPGMANAMLSVGRTLYKWGMALELTSSNPFSPVSKIEVPDNGYVPWPKFVTDYVLEKAPPDLVRMGPIHRDKNGIWVKPIKTKRRRKSFWIPLTVKDAIELDGWSQTPMMFKATRWKSPIARHRDDVYLYSPKGAAYNGTNLRARWDRWLQDTSEGKVLCGQWTTWIKAQVAKYDWEIDIAEAKWPNIHGLRGTGILERRKLGHDIPQIVNDIGMSRQMVEHYMRFRDQMEVGSQGQARLTVVRE